MLVLEMNYEQKLNLFLFIDDSKLKCLKIIIITANEQLIYLIKKLKII